MDMHVATAAVKGCGHREMRIPALACVSVWMRYICGHTPQNGGRSTKGREGSPAKPTRHNLWLSPESMGSPAW